MAKGDLSEIIVVGAGIVGVSTALWLQRQGLKVRLIDRDSPASGTSFGNAGILASIAVVPVPIPGILKKAPRLLLDSNQPLFLRWAKLPHLLPFFLKYLSHANDNSVKRISDALSTLLHDSPNQHLSLASGTGAEQYIKLEDYLFGYESESAFQDESYVWEIRKARGLTFTELSAEELADYDENLAGRFNFGVRCPHHGSITDPGAYVKALAAAFEQNGGTLIQAQVNDFHIDNGRCTGISTELGGLIADKYILTTGIWSAPWFPKLGVSVPMVAERGYHIEYVNPSIELRSPIMVASGKFVVNSMKGRMRCAGVVEFGGAEDPASKAPITFLKKQAQHLFPDLEYDHIEEWMGSRPSTADSLPVIGVSPEADNVLLGFGHQHIGLSAGPKTGRWLAELAMNRDVNTDLSVFSADRNPKQRKGLL